MIWLNTLRGPSNPALTERKREKHKATAVILAGGRSSRLGFDKQLLKQDEGYLLDTLIEQLSNIFDEVILVSNKPELHAHRNIPIISDVYEDVGPLAGFHAGLLGATHPVCYITACDMPWICEAFIHYLLQKYEENPQKPIWVTRKGTMLEPLGGLYMKSLSHVIQDLIIKGERRIQSLYSQVDVGYIPERIARLYSPDWHMFDNINTQADLERYQARCEEVKDLVQNTRNKALGK